MPCYDAHIVHSAGERHRDNVLQAIGASLEAWVSQVKREKAIYHVLNMCSVDVTRKVLVAEAWCPVSTKPRVQEALREAAHHTSASVSLISIPCRISLPPPAKPPAALSGRQGSAHP